MKEFEIFTPTFSKLIKAVDKDSAKIAFEQMFNVIYLTGNDLRK